MSDDLDRLTSRQREVIALIADGLTDAQIGRRLGISTPTTTTHVMNARAVLGALNRAHAVAIAMRAGEIR